MIVPALTFVASALAPIYAGCRPLFAEVSPRDWTLDPADVERRMTPKTRAILAVDYAGQPADVDALADLARRRGCALVVDAAHSIGARHAGRRVGSHADLTAFSFFATKNLSAGEGGAVVARDPALGARLQRLKAHGIVWPEGPRVSGMHDVVELGHNFHLSNLNIVLAREGLQTLDARNEERKRLAAGLSARLLDCRLSDRLELPPVVRDHVFHLYTIGLKSGSFRVSRDEFLRALIAEGIDAGIYYRPVHLFRYFREAFGTAPGSLPFTEALCDRILSLPLFPGMTDLDLSDVAAAVAKVARHYSR